MKHYFLIIKDVITHSIRVMNHSLKLGKKFNCTKEETKILILAALLHDVGKFLIPKKILFKV